MGANTDTRFSGSRVLVTGGAGFIGSTLALRLADAGAQVTVVDALIPGYGGNLFNLGPARPSIRVNISDIRDAHGMNHLVQGADFGAALCRSCGAWYRVEGGVAELLPPRLQDAARREGFQKRHAADWSGWTKGPQDPSRADDHHKLEQKSFYDEDALAYETSMLKLSFWQAFDLTFRGLIRSSGGGLLVEVGCGTGRISVPCRDRFQAIVGFDISEAMVRTAERKRRELPDGAHLRYLVGDAENIPLRDGVADAVVFSGILLDLIRLSGRPAGSTGASKTTAPPSDRSSIF